MKKLLLFILSILIGFTCFGYCENYNFNFYNSMSDNLVYDFNFNLITIGNLSSTVNSSSDKSFNIYFTGFGDSSIKINYLGYYYYSNYYFYKLVCDGFILSGSSYRDSNRISYLVLSGYELNTNSLTNCSIHFCSVSTESDGVCRGNDIVNSYVFNAGSTAFLGYYFSKSGLNGYLNFNGSRVINSRYVGIPSVIDIDVSLIPKFTVNYGSNSYEITEDTDIYINSPVVKDGNTFIYDGLYGINLFYNGLSYFYNKDKLYINTPSWYNNGIFTPVCL